MTTRQQIIDTARSFVGTPWRHQGRVPGRGLDCAGVVTCTGKQTGASTYDFLAYTRQSNFEVFLALFQENAVQIPKQNAAAADIVILPTNGSTHCGILGEQDGALTLIHAYALRRKVVEERFTEEWRARVVAAFAFPGVA